MMPGGTSPRLKRAVSSTLYLFQGFVAFSPVLTVSRLSCSQLQVVLVLQIRPRHPEGRDFHRQESG